MDGPYFFPSSDLKYKSFKLLQWMYKYRNKRCKIYVGTKSLKFTPTKAKVVTELLKINHWIIILKFGMKQFFIENSAVSTTKTINKKSLLSIKNNKNGYFIRNTSEGSEIIAYNHLIRFVDSEKLLNYNINNTEKYQTVIFDPDSIIECCLKYLKENYTFYNRNCQQFVRYINYNIKGNRLSFFSKMRLNFDGFSYVCLLIILIIILLIFYRRTP